MDKRKVFKFTMIVLLFSMMSVAFYLGHEWGQDPYFMEGSFHLSELQIRNRIKEDVEITIPAEAIDLYYVYQGGRKAHCYVALTLTGQKACEAFLRSQFATSIDAFKKIEKPSDSSDGDNIINKVAKTHPYSEDMYRNWDLLKYNEYHVYDNSQKENLIFVYASKQSRIFIYKYYPKGLPCFFCRFL